jgi:predicted O-linked N-acetylglucosamine transferase (SPINDLY family)
VGVPVVTLRGRTMVGCWSASMLKAVGLERLAAETATGYAAAAAQLAADPAALAALRGSLRRRVADSPLSDGVQRARQFHRLCRAVWRRRCLADKGS